MQPTRLSDANNLVDQDVWPAASDGPGLEQGPVCGVGPTPLGPGSGAGSPGTATGGGGAQCVAPRTHTPLAPGALSGSPQPGSRATPPAVSYHHQRQHPHPHHYHHHTNSPSHQRGQSNFSQLPSVDTLFPPQQPQQQHQPLQQQQHHQPQHPTQQQTQHDQQHPAQLEKTYHDLGPYSSPTGQCHDVSGGHGAPHPGYGGPSHGDFSYQPDLFTCPPVPTSTTTTSSNVPVIVPNLHMKGEHQLNIQTENPSRQQCDPSWDGVAYAGPHLSPYIEVKPDPDQAPAPPSVAGGRAGTAGPSPGTSGALGKKPHPRQGYRRPTFGDQRKEKRREQNRRAALKCRLKKKDEWVSMQHDYNRLENENRELQEKIDTIQEEKRSLIEILRSHQQTCSIQVELPPPTP